MKKLLLFVFASIMALGSYAKQQTVCFSVNPPMHCNNCENKIKENLRFEKGVKSVKPSAKDAVVEICYDDEKTNIDALKNGFKKIGYEAQVIVNCDSTIGICPGNGESPSCNGDTQCQGTCHKEALKHCESESKHCTEGEKHQCKHKK